LAQTDPQAVSSREPHAYFVAAAIILLTGFHAAAVWFVNAPQSVFCCNNGSIFGWYESFIGQGWSLFAPVPPASNIHVLVRGRLADGSVTDWYDVSRYFERTSGPLQLSPVREVGEGLAHSAGAPPSTVSISIVTRTSAMVLKLYSPGSLSLQIEVDHYPILVCCGNRRVQSVRYPWQAIPSVAKL